MRLIVLEAKTGDYVVIARRKGNDWYVGAMTDWSDRTIEVTLPLPSGKKYQVEYFADGINADRSCTGLCSQNHETCHRIILLTIKMAPGGGWAAKITVK